MHQTFNSRHIAGAFVVFTGEAGWKEGEVYVGTAIPRAPEPLSPEQARAMGEALIRAADLAEAARP